MWQLRAQKDINEIAQLEAQPARFSDAFKNSHTGSCGKRNAGPQFSLCQDNSHGYSCFCARITPMVIHTSGVQVLLSVELHKP